MASERGATLSPCGTYRYFLWRELDGFDLSFRTMLFVMLNPSTADGEQDDPTIRRCLGFARREGCGRLDVVNLFGLRATDPRELVGHPDPIGPENDAHVEVAALRAHVIVAAWGVHGDRYPERVRAISALLPHPWCLGQSRSGQPLHPLMLPRDRRLNPWRAAGEGEGKPCG